MCKATEDNEAHGNGKIMLEKAKQMLANGDRMLKENAECTDLLLAQVKKLQASTDHMKGQSIDAGQGR